MENVNSNPNQNPFENANPNPNPAPNAGPGTDGQRRDYRDWREERRAWRHEMREKRLRAPWHGLFWGLLLVALGGLFLANQQGWLTGDDWWHWLLVALGGVFLLDGLAHFFSSDRGYSVGRFIPGIVLLFVGLAFVYGIGAWWPIVLIAVGVTMLLAALIRRI